MRCRFFYTVLVALLVAHYNAHVSAHALRDTSSNYTVRIHECKSAVEEADLITLRAVPLLNSSSGDVNARKENVISQLEAGLRRFECRASEGCTPDLEYVPCRCLSRLAEVSCHGSDARYGAFTAFQLLAREGTVLGWHKKIHSYQLEMKDCHRARPIAILSIENPAHMSSSKGTRITDTDELMRSFHSFSFRPFWTNLSSKLLFGIPYVNDGRWSGSQLLPLAPSLHSRPYLASVVGNVFLGAKRVGNSWLREVLCGECSGQQDCVARCGNRTKHKRDLVTAEAAEAIYEIQSKSIFCMQPWGDSASRKSFYDALLAGCINVLFVPLGYEGLLEGFGDYRLYSIVVPLKRVSRDGGALAYLRSIGREKVEELHENILSHREKFIYSATPVPVGHHDAISVIMNSLPSRLERWELERGELERGELERGELERRELERRELETIANENETLGMPTHREAEVAAATTTKTTTTKTTTTTTTAAAATTAHMKRCNCRDSPILILGDKKSTRLIYGILSKLPGAYIASIGNSSIEELLADCEKGLKSEKQDSRVLARYADLIMKAVRVPQYVAKWGWREEGVVSVNYYATLKKIFPCSQFISAPDEREWVTNQSGSVIARNSGGAFADVWEKGDQPDTSDTFYINARHATAKNLTSMMTFLGYQCQMVSVHDDGDSDDRDNDNATVADAVDYSDIDSERGIPSSPHKTSLPFCDFHVVQCNHSQNDRRVLPRDDIRSSKYRHMRRV